jgi:hypothetical protein
MKDNGQVRNVYYLYSLTQARRRTAEQEVAINRAGNNKKINLKFRVLISKPANYVLAVR